MNNEDFGSMQCFVDVRNISYLDRNILLDLYLAIEITEFIERDP